MTRLTEPWHTKSVTHLFSGGGAGAVIEEQTPFELLEADGSGVFGAFFIPLDCFNQIDKCIGIPAAGDEAEEGFVGREGVKDLTRVVGHLLKNGMGGAAGVPVFAVGKIAFAAVHDGVPEAAGSGLERLADVMGFIKPVVPEPEAGEHSVGVVLTAEEAGEELFGGGGGENCFGFGISVAARDEAAVGVFDIE